MDDPRTLSVASALRTALWMALASDASRVDIEMTIRLALAESSLGWRLRLAIADLSERFLVRLALPNNDDAARIRAAVDQDKADFGRNAYFEEFLQIDIQEQAEERWARELVEQRSAPWFVPDGYWSGLVDQQLAKQDAMDAEEDVPGGEES